MSKQYKALRRRIEDADMLQGEAAERIGMAPGSLSSRLSGRTAFDVNDIRALCELLGIPRSKVGDYFLPDIPDPADAVPAGPGKKLPDWLTGRSA